MTNEKLGARSEIQIAVVCSAIVALATTAIAYAILHSNASAPLSSYIGYIVTVPCIAVGLWRPFVAVLSALILLSINPGYPIAHAFTSAPSDYLIAAATVSLIFSERFRWGSTQTLPLAAAGLVVLSATIALVVTLSGTTEISFSKTSVAEYLGLLNMACYVAAPALALRSHSDIKALSIGLALGCGTLLVCGLAGSIDTLACTTDGMGQMYTTAGFRDKGLLGDPNIFGTVVATLAPFFIFWMRRLGYGWAALSAYACVAAIAFSGSRTAIAIGCGGALLSLCLVGRHRLWIVPIAGSTLLLLLLTPTFAWPILPCLIDGPKERVYFSERNSESAYYVRIEVEKAGFSELLKETPELKQACISAEGKQPIEILSQQQDVQNCIIDSLSKSLARPTTSTSGYKKSPAFAAVLDRITLDQSRRLLWEHAFAIGSENPIFGIGLSNLAQVTPNRWSSHNTALTTFAQQGIVGILLLSLAIGLSAHSGLAGFWNMPARVQGIFAAVLIGALMSLAGALAQDMLRQPIIWILFGFFATGNYFKSNRDTSS